MLSPSHVDNLTKLIVIFLLLYAKSNLDLKFVFWNGWCDDIIGFKD
jgi:hypothetical protein